MASAPPTDAVGFIEHQRYHKVRNPVEVVLKLTPIVLSNKLSSYPLSDQLQMLESFSISSMDVGEHGAAKRAVEILEGIMRSGAGGVKAPEESSRARRLRGLLAESAKDFSTASAIYTELLEQNPANYFCYKRRYAIQKAQKKYPQAIKAMNEYLTLQPADSSAWQELGQLYFDLGDYKSAAFAFEEVVLHHPLDALCHSQLGDAYFCSAGGNKAGELGKGKNILELLKLARNHYAKSCELEGKRTNVGGREGLVKASEACVAWYDKNDEEGESADDRDLALALALFGKEQ